MIEFSDTIFVGYVKEQTDISYDILSSIPVTIYDIIVLKCYKGTVNDDVVKLFNVGGYDLDGNMILHEGDFLPKIEGVYLFLTKDTDDGNFFVDNPQQKIKLINADLTRNENQEILKQYFDIEEESQNEEIE